MFGWIKKQFNKVKEKVINAVTKVKTAVAVAFTFGSAQIASATPIAAPDMTDAIGSVTNVFGAVLGVAVLIYGFKKVRSLL